MTQTYVLRSGTSQYDPLPSTCSTAPPVSPDLLAGVERVVTAFTAWLRKYGGSSWDHQTFYSGPIGGTAKTLYYRNRHLGIAAVAPIVLCEAFLPGARRFFGQKTRFPIADAHYAMGFAFLSRYAGDAHHQRAVEFLRALKESRSPGYEHYCWGYPFDWVTSAGTLKAWTPFITSTPYAYEAFRNVHAIDRNPEWRAICASIAEHGAKDVPEFPVSRIASSCGYGPYDRKGGIVNAAAYRAWLLTVASIDFGRSDYRCAAEHNLNFVFEAQQPNGSWFYSVDGVRDFVDHYHTCFVLKALAKIDRHVDHAGCKAAIAAGLEYYVKTLFDDQGLPKPFSKPPRLTVYRRELYDYAECINLCVLLRDRFPALNRTLDTVLRDILRRWVKADGSFRSRQLLVGWDNVPMHRWAQSQLFRSLTFLLHDEGAVGGRN